MPVAHGFRFTLPPFVTLNEVKGPSLRLPLRPGERILAYGILYEMGASVCIPGWTRPTAAPFVCELGPPDQSLRFFRMTVVGRLRSVVSPCPTTQDTDPSVASLLQDDSDGSSTVSDLPCPSAPGYGFLSPASTPPTLVGRAWIRPFP